jgi:AcrR family transcriptional regulator
MAKTSSEPLAADRRRRRRQLVIDEALDHALDIMGEQGVGALSISEMARRMGVRGPSLYKYFDSLHAVYDALFARGQVANAEAVATAVEGQAPGVDRIRAAARATVRWCVSNPALAQLLYWRVIPGFEPSEASFAAGVKGMADARAEFTEAVRRGQLGAQTNIDTALQLLTVQISGLITQQMANEPGAAFDAGMFTALTDEAIEMILVHHQPRRR